MAYSKEDRRQLFKFFESVLLLIHESPVYYERLRGYVSEAPPNVRNYVRKELKGEKLLQFFQKRKNYFIVEDKYYVALKTMRCCNQSPDNIVDTEVNEYDDEFYLEGYDDDDFISYKSSRSNSVLSTTVSTGNSVSGDDSFSTSKDDDEIKKNEEETLRYFCKKLEDGQKRDLDSISVDSKKAQRYLKNMKSDVAMFFRCHPKIFCIDADNYVSLVSNPFIKKIQYPQEIQNIALEPSTVGDIPDESFTHFNEQTIENVLQCADFFVNILKKKYAVHIDKLSGYLSQSCESFGYLKANYSHFSQFFLDVPQLFSFDGREVSLINESVRLLKEAKKLYSKSKNEYSSMSIQDAIKVLFSPELNSRRRFISEVGKMQDISEIENSHFSNVSYSNEDNSSILHSNTLSNDASSSVECNISKEDFDIEKGFEDYEECSSLLSGGFAENDISKPQTILVSPVSIPKHDDVQNSTVHEIKSLILSNLNSIHSLNSSSFDFTHNKVLQIMLSAIDEFIEDFKEQSSSSQKLDILIDNKGKTNAIFSRDNMSDFVDILYTIELLCLEKIENEHVLKLNYEYETVKFFTEILEKMPNIGYEINSLIGSLSQAPDHVLFFIKQLYKGEKIQDFFESHEEFIINSHKWVKLSSSYKSTLNSRLLNHENNTVSKKSYCLGNLYDSHWFKLYADVYGCFSEIFCFLARKEQRGSKISRLSGIITKLSHAQQDFINSFCVKGTAEKTEMFMNSFRIFSFSSKDYVEIDSTIHLSFLRHCVIKFADLLKDKETKLSDFCYFLNDCVNGDDTETFKYKIIESVQTFLNISSCFAYSTLPSILNDVLFDLMERQIFSFGVIKILEECGLFEVEKGKISLKENTDEIKHSNEVVDSIAVDVGNSDCDNIEVSQGTANVFHLNNATEDKLETIETDEVMKYSNVNTENKTSESLDINLLVDEINLNMETTVTYFESVEDLSKTDVNNYLDNNTEERGSESEEISKNGTVMNNNNNYTTSKIFDPEGFSDKLKILLQEEKEHFVISSDSAETTEFSYSIINEPNKNTVIEREDETMHEDNKCESDCEPTVTLSKESSSVATDSNLMEKTLEKPENNSEEAEVEMYDVGSFSQSEMVLSYELDNNFPEKDSVCSDSLTVSDIKEGGTLIASPQEIHSIVHKIQKVANIEVLPIETCQKKSPVRYLSVGSDKHTVASPLSEEKSDERKINEKQFDEPQINEEQSEEPQVNYEQSEEPQINVEQSDEPEITVEQSDEHRINAEQSDEHRINAEQSDELETNEEWSFIYEYETENNDEESSVKLESRLESLNCGSELDLHTDSNILVCDIKKSTESVNDNLLSENDTKIGSIQTTEESVSQDFQHNEINKNSVELPSEKLEALTEEKFKVNPSTKEEWDTVDASVMSDIKSRDEENAEEEVIHQVTDHCYSDEISQDLPVNSLEKNIFSRNEEEEESTRISRSPDNEVFKDDADALMNDASCYGNFYSADSSVPIVKMAKNLAESVLNGCKSASSKSNNPSVSSLSFSQGSSRKSSNQKDDDSDKNYIHNQNMNASFFQPLSAKIVLLTLDSCIVETTINGENKLVFCLKTSFHCDQHIDCPKCFDSLTIGDKVLCFVPPKESCKLGNMCFSFMFCKDAVGEECQTSNLFECKELSNGFQYRSSNSKENLQQTENAHTNDITDKICTHCKVHSAIDRDRTCCTVDKECQVEHSEFIQGYPIYPSIKKFTENECQTVLSGRLKSYPAVVEKECQVKYSSFSRATGTQSVYQSLESECQTIISGEIKLCSTLFEKECQVNCSMSCQNTQTVNELNDSECQTELSGKIKLCPVVSEKECQVKCETLFQGTQTLNNCNEEACQTDISGSIKSSSYNSSLGCQTVISGRVKKCVNLANKSCQASHISTVSSQITQTSFLDKSSENDCMSHVQSLDWASYEVCEERDSHLPESKTSELSDVSCQTISTGPIMMKNYYLS